MDECAVDKVEITLSDNTGIHRIKDDMVITKKGVSCKFSDGYCIDTLEGYLTWENMPNENCGRDSYLVLYKGLANKIVVKSPQNDKDQYVLYSIQDGNFLATLNQKGEKMICGIKIYQNDGQNPLKIVQACQTRWLSIESAVSRIYTQ